MMMPRFFHRVRLKALRYLAADDADGDGARYLAAGDADCVAI